MIITQQSMEHLMIVIIGVDKITDETSDGNEENRNKRHYEFKIMFTVTLHTGYKVYAHNKAMNIVHWYVRHNFLSPTT